MNGLIPIDEPENKAHRHVVFLFIPPLLWGLILGLMFANIAIFNHSPLAFRIICISTFFASPLFAAYTIGILVVFIRKRYGWRIAFASLLLIPLAVASFVAVLWLIHGIQLQT